MDDGAPAGLPDLQRAVRQVLDRVSEVMGDPDLAPGRATFDLRSADAALRSAERLLTVGLAGFRGTDDAQARFAAALIDVQLVRNSVREAGLVRRAAAVRDVQAALRRLRAVGTTAALVERAPLEINGLGYRRCLFSRLRGPDWSARSAFAHEDPWLAAELVRIGSAAPGRLGRELPETELVRRRDPILVRDAQNNPRVHRGLIDLAHTTDYIAAPLIAREEVVGLIHADRHADTGTVDSFDRDLLGLFAEGLGLAFERVFYRERLGAVRSSLQEQVRALGEPTGDPDGPEDAFGPDAGTPRAEAQTSLAVSEPVARARPLHSLEWPLSELTRRELEVLQHLLDGESNARIAAGLYVSVETVKTHVKHLLRKLGAANRAEAVSLAREIVARSAG
ncbi:LuxR C-terminal-related transcriptional regulator [Streptomyces sp. NPDC127119]|uniref:LuxR C-terminal-related transcriptional regulator n=1 Tax=Streptomyces sp. NPDC127119 TaxID=3345370 RepID=UPI003633FE45